MFRTTLVATAAAALCVGLPAVATAQSEESAGVVTAVNGDATLFRAVAAARPVSLRMRDEIFVRDRIHTLPHSLVRVLLGGKALITVRELSVLTITEEAGRVTVDLQSGKVGVAVVKARMRPGEVIEIRSPNATAAVRGTVFVVEVDPGQTGPAAGAVPTTTTRVHLFHGALDVSARLDPVKSQVRLAELQSVVVSGNTLGAVSKISRDQVAALTADLKPQQVKTPDAPLEFTGDLVAREQGRAIALASTLLPSSPTAPVPAALKSVRGAVAGLSAPVKGVTNVVTGLTGNTAETLERLMDSLGLSGSGDGLVAGVGGTVDRLATTVGNAVDGLGSGVGNTLEGLGNGLGNTLGGLSNGASPSNGTSPVGAPAAPAAPPIVSQMAPPVVAPAAPPIVTPTAPPIVNPIVPPIVNPLAPVLNPVVNPILNLLKK